MTYREQMDMVESAANTFPKEFGLRAFPGVRFRVNVSNSFISDGKVMLYTDALRDGQWLAFAKGTPEELRREVTK